MQCENCGRLWEGEGTVCPDCNWDAHNDQYDESDYIIFDWEKEND